MNAARKKSGRPQGFWRKLSATLFLFIAGITLQAGAQPYLPPATHRADISLDLGWKFIKQDVVGAQNTVFDDSSWTSLNLPHTWNNLDGLDGGNNYYRGIGWYRRHYSPDASLTNRVFFLKFDGAFSVADVYVNGAFAGEHQGGFAAFVFDVTPLIAVGSDNVIAVKVSNAFNTNIPPLTADFTFFGGLYRDVHLLTTDSAHVSPLDCGSPGIYLKTTGVTSNSANLQVTAVISNAASSAQSLVIRTLVTDATTNIVTSLTNITTMPPHSVSNLVAGVTVNSPRLWDGLNDPYLYQTFTEVLSGSNVVDLVSQPLGFRSLNVDPTNGFFLNGRHYDLHGVNMHQDWLSNGWALTNAQRASNFVFLNEIGATFLRLCHYEHDDYTYQLADKSGLCVWAEVPIINYITEAPAFYTNSLQQLRELIRQRYNHPSVVCWSVYNEITLSAGPTPTNLINQEVQLVAQEDSTRPSTAAANTSDSDPSTLYTQLIAFNKYYGWYSSPLNGIGSWADAIHSNYPNRCVGVSEYGAGASINQHSENPVFPTNAASSFHPEEWQNIVHETNWLLMAARPFIWCKLIWNEFDFASDARSEGDTAGRNDKGLVTYNRQTRKDAYYFYKAEWTTNPMVYITGHTFPSRTTNQVIAKVYANCDSVELFVNGTSQGVVTNGNGIFSWPVVLLGGSNFVQAFGIKGGSNVSDSLAWIAPVSPPLVTITSPLTSTIYLKDTNAALALAATVLDYESNSSPSVTTSWSKTGGPGAVTFDSPAALSTMAHFATTGVYTVTLQASKGALVSTAVVTVVVGNVPYGPAMKIRFAFEDAGPGATTPSDTNGGSVNAMLQMLSSSGTATNLHGSTNSGVAGLTTGSRALDFSSIPGQGGSGAIVATTNASLGLGNATNFTVTFWFKMSTALTNNIGPRMFVFGNSTNTDCGTANSIGMKFQDANDLWFFANTTQATAAFAGSLPVRSWIYVAMSFDGTNISLYEGDELSTATLVSVTPAAGLTVPLGGSASLDIGNRLNRDRGFAGWMDDFRFYTGGGDLSFVESVRQAAAGPAGLFAIPGISQVGLSWRPLLGATSYNIKRSGISGGPYTVISTAGSVTGTNYTDLTAVNGMTYYYVVSAATSISAAPETANSAVEAMATLPVPPLPPTASYNSPVYQGMTLHLSASAVAGAAYSWSGPNGFASGVQNPGIINASSINSGTYGVVATVGGVASSPGTVAVIVNPPLVFSVNYSLGKLVFDWPFGSLQSATNLTGPWTTLSNAAAPFTNAPAGPQQFFRVMLQ